MIVNMVIRLLDKGGRSQIELWFEGVHNCGIVRYVCMIMIRNISLLDGGGRSQFELRLNKYIIVQVFDKHLCFRIEPPFCPTEVVVAESISESSSKFGYAGLESQIALVLAIANFWFEP